MFRAKNVLPDSNGFSVPQFVSKLTILSVQCEVKQQQECIPVGCVPSAAVAAGGGWVYPSMHWAGGVYLSMHWAVEVCPSIHWVGGGGVCPGGVSAWGCLPRGVCPREGVSV